MPSALAQLKDMPHGQTPGHPEADERTISFRNSCFRRTLRSRGCQPATGGLKYRVVLKGPKTNGLGNRPASPGSRRPWSAEIEQAGPSSRGN
jgi:hypothetical protein